MSKTNGREEWQVVPTLTAIREAAALGDARATTVRSMLGIERGTMHARIRRYEAAGWVRATKAGATVTLAVTPLGLAKIAAAGPQPDEEPTGHQPTLGAEARGAATWCLAAIHAGNGQRVTVADIAERTKRPRVDVRTELAHAAAAGEIERDERGSVLTDAGRARVS
jgi:DNA-binding MarR family transcriptional regulator